MSKPTLPAAPTLLPAEALVALDAARAALDGRETLLSLQRKLTTDLAEARRLSVERDEAVRQAETDVILAGDPPPAHLVEAAEQARAAAKSVADVAVRLEHDVAALPGRLLQADEAITAAAEPMRVQQQAAFESARSVYETKLRVAVDELASVLHLGHALNAASGHQLRHHLDGLNIPAPFSGDQPILREGSRLLAAGGTLTDLSVTWRGNPEAAALHALHAPLRPALDALQRQTARISLEEQDRRLADRDRAVAARPSVTTGGPPSPPLPPYTAPPGAGPGRSWTTEMRVANPPVQNVPDGR